MAKILITGGAGFIGAHVAQALHARGDTVHLVDDFNNRYDPALKEARVQHLLPPGSYTLSRLDIRDRAAVEQLCTEQRFEYVVHLAAWASVQPSIRDPHIYTAVNIDGTVNILEAARKTGVRHVIFASSSSVYGGLTTLPFREDMDVSRPMSPYAATKRAGEIMAATWHQMYRLPVTCLRFFTVYGPWGRPEMALFSFARAILTEQPLLMRGYNTMRDFTYIDDIVSGIIAALDTPDGFRIYNLGESDGVRLPRLISALETALGKSALIQEVPLPPGDIPATLANISRARQELGYAPHVPVEEGVQRFSRWYLEWYVPRFETARVKATPTTAPAQ